MFPEEVVYRHLALDSPFVATVDIDRVVCPKLPSCEPLIDEVVVRLDGSHLNPDFGVSIFEPVGDAMSATGFVEAVAGATP